MSALSDENKHTRTLPSTHAHSLFRSFWILHVSAKVGFCVQRLLFVSQPPTPRLTIMTDSVGDIQKSVPWICVTINLCVCVFKNNCWFFAFTDVSQSVSIPVLIGSGVTHDNMERYLDANGMIIGSHFKEGGHWANGVDPERVKRFMGKRRDLLK